MKVLVAGDFCPQGRVSSILEKGDYQFVLGSVKELLPAADYAIVNFECPVCGERVRPIEKHGPNLRCTTKGIAAIKWAGFRCVTLANNHFYDYGEEGIRQTLDSLTNNNILYVGGGRTEEECVEESCPKTYCELDPTKDEEVKKCIDEGVKEADCIQKICVKENPKTGIMSVIGITTLSAATLALYTGYRYKNKENRI